MTEKPSLTIRQPHLCDNCVAALIAKITDSGQMPLWTYSDCCQTFAWLDLTGDTVTLEPRAMAASEVRQYLKDVGFTAAAAIPLTEAKH